jgi:hypothetical protein
MASNVEGESWGIHHDGQSAREEGSDWKQAHNELVRLAADQARLDWEVGAWLLCAARAGTPRRLGYSGITDCGPRPGTRGHSRRTG